MTGVQTCALPIWLHEFDKRTTGLEPGTLTIIAGRPSSGKSLVSVSMAFRMAEMEVPVAIFSMEMSARSLLDRMMCGKARVDLMRFRSGSTTTEENRLLHDSLNYIYGLPIYIDEKPNITMAEVARKLEKMKREHGIDRKSTRLNSSHIPLSRMPSSA